MNLVKSIALLSISLCVISVILPANCLALHSVNKTVTISQQNGTLLNKKSIRPILDQRLEQTIKAVRIPFIENKGQTDENVSFYAKAFFGTLFVQNDGTLTYRLKADENKDLIFYESFAKVIKPVGISESISRVNYFKGNDRSKWYANLPTYNGISLGEVFPGVLLNLRAYGNNVEKVFKVLPKQNPSSIKIEVTGVSKLELTNSGELVVYGKGGNSGKTKFSKPIAYQPVANGRNKSVQVAYVIHDNSHYGFQVGKYDNAIPLIIDPVLTYSSYIGGPQGSYGEVPADICVDSEGAVYITGYATSNFPVTNNAFQKNFGGGILDAMVLKLNPSGSELEYATYLGGSGYDTASSIAVDSYGAAFITGVARSGDFPITPNAFQTNFGGSWEDAFVAKISPSGSTLEYSTFLGGSTPDWGMSIDVDSTGCAYAAGSTRGGNFPVTSGAFQTSFGGSDDGYVVKLSPDGSDLVYSTFFGGSGHDHIGQIIVDPNSYAYVVGWTASPNFPITPDAFQTFKKGPNNNNNQSRDGYILKLNPTGSVLEYSTFLGGSEMDLVFTVFLDEQAMLYVAGSTDSLDFPVTDGVFQNIYGGNGDIFVSKIELTSEFLLYSSYLGGNAYEYLTGRMAVDSSGSLLVTGRTESINDFPVTDDAFQYNFGGGTTDAFIAQVNPSGSDLEYASYLGGIGDDFGRGLFINEGTIHIAGVTSSVDFPVTPDSFDTTYNGANDIFVVKFSSNKPPVAICQDKTSKADDQCSGSVEAKELAPDSYDPDGDEIIITADPETPYPLGDTEVLVTVTDDSGEYANCKATVTVVDEEKPMIQSNAPTTIIPPDTPISFTATVSDNCSATVEITGYDCYKFTKKGKRIDKTDSCEVAIDGNTVTILDSGGVGTSISWDVTAIDSSENETTAMIVVEVVNPGKGKGKK